MGIEQDIQQSNFRNEYQKLGINIMYTANWLNERVGRFLAQEDITQQQYNILRILRGSECPLSTLQIRERMLDKMSDTSRIVDRLIVKELVQKSACKSDKRLVDIILTEKGMQLVNKLDAYNNQIDAILKSVTEKEAATMNAILDKLRSLPDQTSL
jgi:DNA-binding MarR family transcriptional regulator